MFSGYKLLGGPQAGIIAGKKELVTRVRRHPLFRALRVDKLTTAALEVTLGAYLRAAWDEIPALRMIRTGAQELKHRSENFLRELRPELPLDEVEMEIVDGASLAGGGSTPTQALPTKVIRIASARYSAAQLEQRLRAGANLRFCNARHANGRLRPILSSFQIFDLLLGLPRVVAWRWDRLLCPRRGSPRQCEN